MDKSNILKTILPKLKNLNFKGNFFQILNTILLALVMGWMFIDSKPIDNTQYQKIFDEINTLHKENVELKALLQFDSIQLKLDDLDFKLEQKTNSIENELIEFQLEKQQANNYIISLHSNQLFEFLSKYDTSGFFQPYIIVVE